MSLFTIFNVSGSAVSAQFQLASQTVLASSEPAGAGEKNSSAKKPTASSAGATQMPEASSPSIRMKRMAEIVPASISRLPPL